MEVKYKHKLGPPPRRRTILWSTAALPCHVALAHVLKWAWECHEAKAGEACTVALAEGISVRDRILTRCVNFCRCEWTSLAEAGCVSKCGWENFLKAMCVRFLSVQPGVVPTCSVTERTSFCQQSCCSFQEGRFGVRLDFLLEHF